MKPEPTKDSMIKQKDEALIAEFKKNILKTTGLPDWGSLSWYNNIDQAARNLYLKAYKAGKEDGGAGV